MFLNILMYEDVNMCRKVHHTGDKYNKIQIPVNILIP